jgi:hypothetical protein
MQSSFLDVPLFIPDKGDDRDNHEQQNEKLESIIDHGYSVDLYDGDHLENTIGVEQCHDDSTVEEKGSQGKKY